MEIGSYNVPDKYVAVGGVGLLALGFVLSRKKGSGDQTQVAEIKPADGMSWSDIFPPSDSGKLIGPGGPTGPPGDSGPPGLPGTPAPDNPIVITDPPGSVGPTPDPGTTKPPKDKQPKDGGRSCNTNRDCPDGKRCKDGRCEDKSGNDGKDKQGNNSDRPKMPDNRGDTAPIPDPRLDKPKDRKRRDEGNNKIDNGKRDTRADNGGKRDDTNTGNNRGNDGRVVSVNPVSGNVNIDVSGGRERDTGKNANANAGGGTVRLGNVDKGTNANINAGGGTAVAKAQEPTKHEQKQEKKDDKKDDKKKGKGAGYGALPGLNENGFGRLDGRGGTGDGFTRTNISPGTTTGGFSPAPQALGRRSAKILEGETLKGLAARQIGVNDQWPRIVRLNQDIEVPRGKIPAGTVFRV